jgi:hypothetical protein
MDAEEGWPSAFDAQLAVFAAWSAAAMAAICWLARRSAA